uniref:Small ribosomal subunit protein uS3m n=1 Tax=Schizosaccharomyces pombe TaxID=4896 RepID=A0A516IM21_SCHPM|nr:ribosomal protein S3 [Schizosaccharomyces pombe]QDP17837.1 ribosomal protein S3 [Schizosaccharomyces pombe]QDP17847.1 ribosomal protein S3 [Schizosaccharomyces pombe]
MQKNNLKNLITTIVTNAFFNQKANFSIPLKGVIGDKRPSILIGNININFKSDSLIEVSFPYYPLLNKNYPNPSIISNIIQKALSNHPLYSSQNYSFIVNVRALPISTPYGSSLIFSKYIAIIIGSNPKIASTLWVDPKRFINLPKLQSDSIFKILGLNVPKGWKGIHISLNLIKWNSLSSRGRITNIIKGSVPLTNNSNGYDESSLAIYSKMGTIQIKVRLSYSSNL